VHPPPASFVVACPEIAKETCARFVLATSFALGLALVAGCGNFVRLKSEVKRLDSDVYLHGVVRDLDASAGKVGVIVYRQPEAAPLALVDVTILGEGESGFAFSLPPAPDYRVAAFQDRNGNAAYDPGEPWWMHGPPDPVTFDARRRSDQLVVQWRHDAMPAAMHAGLRAARERDLAAAMKDSRRLPVALGRVVDWDAPALSRNAAKLGLWEPATALNRYGIGIYFLEPYDPGRVPVLFVHGISGAGGDWRKFVPELDAKRYQAWLFSYPSGLRLGDVADAMDRAVAQLHERYGFARLEVVAHSMGGLVSRRYVLNAAQRGHAGWLHHFVTLSTPWGGHEAAAMGVEYAPEAIPAWLDMQTGSEFTKAIQQEALPAAVRHHLAFTFHGDRSMVLPESNDGVVSVASELAMPIQQAAASVRGFDLTHVGVLESPEVVRWVEGALQSAARDDVK
jgi:pimeloyl-ACP methyl ester carboxylesterase